MSSAQSSRERDHRVFTVGAIILAGIGLLLAGLWYVQVATALVYIEDQEIQSMRTVRIPAVRGSILDIHGRPLAQDKPTFVVNAYLEELRHHFREEWKNNKPEHKLSKTESEQLEIAVRHRVVSRFTDQLKLSQHLDITPKQLQSHFSEKRALPLAIINNVSQTNIARFAENSWKVPGLELEVTPKRHYPSLSVAHIVGHLRRKNNKDNGVIQYNYHLPDYEGKLGAEKIFDQYLCGQPGTRAVQVNNMGYRQVESMPAPPMSGSNVFLTLDRSIQESTMKALEKGLNKTGAKAGAAIVMAVNSGDITAMVSAPVFDPNQFTPGISHSLWNHYLTNRPSALLFRATQERYPPGSIFKIISGLALLENGLDPAKHMQCRGSYRIGRRTINCTANPGLYDFKRAFKHSCNSYFIHHSISREHGIKHIIKMGEQFHLGKRTGLLPEQETSGQFPSTKDVLRGWSDGDTANLSLGQGPITVTPLQMTLLSTAIANGGTIYRPRIIARISPPNANNASSSINFPQSVVHSQLNVRKKNLDIVREAMLADVSDPEGTGHAARIEGYNICGKTGTAQTGRGRKITWFTSFAPYKEPIYAVVVMVENGASGGKTCAPIAKEIYEALISRDKQTNVAEN